MDLKNEQKGLLWILDEESIFPGANDSSFLARVYVHHCSDSKLDEERSRERVILMLLNGTYSRDSINAIFKKDYRLWT